MSEPQWDTKPWYPSRRLWILSWVLFAGIVAYAAFAFAVMLRGM
jgi:hypothetical protein